MMLAHSLEPSLFTGVLTLMAIAYLLIVPAAWIWSVVLLVIEWRRVK